MTRTLKAGDTVADRYAVKGLVVEIPAGTWYRVLDQEVEVEVGLLIVKNELLPDEDAQNRFLGAVVETRGIRHRQLVKLFDAGRDQDAIYMTAQMCQSGNPPKKPDKLAAYLNGVADALDAVHRAGQVHGRMEPGDFVEVAGLVKLTGAGLFSELDPTVAKTTWKNLTRFWAPEVIRGERPTPRSDVFSLAAITAELLVDNKATDPFRAMVELKAKNQAIHDALKPSLSLNPDDRPVSPSLTVARLGAAVYDDDDIPTAYYVKNDLENVEKSAPKRPGSSGSRSPSAKASRTKGRDKKRSRGGRSSSEEKTVVERPPKKRAPSESAEDRQPDSRDRAAKRPVMPKELADRLGPQVGDNRPSMPEALRERRRQTAAGRGKKSSPDDRTVVQKSPKPTGKKGKPPSKPDKTVVQRRDKPAVEEMGIDPALKSKIPALASLVPIGPSKGPLSTKGKPSRSRPPVDSVPDELLDAQPTTPVRAPAGRQTPQLATEPPTLVRAGSESGATTPRRREGQTDDEPATLVRAGSETTMRTDPPTRVRAASEATERTDPPAQPRPLSEATERTDPPTQPRAPSEATERTDAPTKPRPPSEATLRTDAPTTPRAPSEATIRAGLPLAAGARSAPPPRTQAPRKPRPPSARPPLGGRPTSGGRPTPGSQVDDEPETLVQTPEPPTLVRAASEPSGPRPPLKMMSLKPPSEQGVKRTPIIPAIDRPELAPKLRAPSHPRAQTAQPANLGRYAPPSGGAYGQKKSSWLYMVLAAVVSAGLAVVITLAILGDDGSTATAPDAAPPDAASPAAIPDATPAPPPKKTCKPGLLLGEDEEFAYCIEPYEWPGKGKRPTLRFNWTKAQNTCKDAGLRLCTPREWEHACRGEGGATFPYGMKYDRSKCNTGKGKRGKMVAAGSRADCKSAVGAFDMSGNAAEWVSNGEIRGGSVKSRSDNAVRCSAKRTRKSPKKGYKDVGFRCCADPTVE